MEEERGESTREDLEGRGERERGEVRRGAKEGKTSETCHRLGEKGEVDWGEKKK